MNTSPTHTIPEGVSVFIYRQAASGAVKFLLMLRHPNDGGFWQGPGGGIEPGETIAETARREVAEECGLAIGQLTELQATLSFPLKAEEIGTRFAPGITQFTIRFMIAPLTGTDDCPTFEGAGDDAAHVDHRWVTAEAGLALLHSEPHRAAFREAATTAMRLLSI